MQNLKRGSIFSNGSINGFKSALFLPSEFYPDSESEACIPIDELPESSALIDLQLLRFQELNMNENAESPKKKMKLFQEDYQEDCCVSPKQNYNNNYFEHIIIENMRRRSTQIENQHRELDKVDPRQFYYNREDKMDNSTCFGSTQTLSTEMLNNTQNSNNFLSSESQGNQFYISQQHQAIPNFAFNPLQINPSAQLPVSMNTMVYLNLIKEKNGGKPLNTDCSPGKKQRKSLVLNHKSSSFKEGDWICCKCNNFNYAFRDLCNRCDKHRSNCN